MKIAIIADSFLPDETTGVNGTQVQLYNLSKAFRSRGMEIHYLAMTGKFEKTEENIEGINIHWMENKPSLLAWLRNFINYSKLLDEIEPDVLYQRGRASLTYAAANWAKRHGKRFVWGSNGEDSLEFWKRLDRLNKSDRSIIKKIILFPQSVLQDILIHKGIRGASRVINQTEHQKQRLEDNYGKQGTVLPNYFLPPSPDKMRKKENIVLWVGNLGPNKQPEVFIQLAEYCRECSNTKFILAGGTSDSNYQQSIINKAANLENLEFIGAIPFKDTNDYFSRARIFVNTSRKDADGLPNTFIQAWLNRTPVLSLNHDPNNWMKTHGIGYCAGGNLEKFLQEGAQMISEIERLDDRGDIIASFARNTFAAEETIDTYLRIFEGNKK